MILLCGGQYREEYLYYLEIVLNSVSIIQAEHEVIVSIENNLYFLVFFLLLKFSISQQHHFHQKMLFYQKAVIFIRSFSSILMCILNHKNSLKIHEIFSGELLKRVFLLIFKSVILKLISNEHKVITKRLFTCNESCFPSYYIKITLIKSSDSLVKII